MKITLANKVVLVTGASRGIGKELISAFAKEGAKVVINYLHSENEAKQLQTEILKYNSNCIIVKADVRKKEDVQGLYDQVISYFGKLDVLINNAGICSDDPIQFMSEEKWKSVLDVNLTGAFLCSRIFSEAMIQQNSGIIVNIASLKGQEGSQEQVNYSASKAGLIGFTKALAKELGPYNISVNAVCPGYILTDLNKESIQKKIKAQSKSIINPDVALKDLINFIMFFCSDAISGVSGRVFNLDSRVL